MKKNNEALLQMLNKEFGFPDAKTATYTKIKQYYDETTAQHIIFLELKISRGEKTIVLDKGYKNKQRLLNQLVAMQKKT